MKKILALIVALVAALTLTVAVSGPAQAYGWSGQRCYYEPGNDANVCMNIHSLAAPGGFLRVDQVQLCAAHIPGGYTRFNGTKASTIAFPTSTVALAEAAAGTCKLTTFTRDMSPTACYTVRGTLDLGLYPDLSYSIRGRVSGGAC